MTTSRIYVLGMAGALAGLIPLSPVAAGGGGAEITHLYREDAAAEFAVPEGDCGPARSQVGVGAHQDFFWSNTTPKVRSVQFGVSIQVFDCAEQFVVGASGVVTSPPTFNIAGFLTRARIEATIEACQYFPEPGECFPVEVDLRFRGVGGADTDRNDTNIREPDCRIIEHDKSAVRSAAVSGTISYTLPGHEPRTLQIDTDDLGPAGASLSNASEFQFVKGSSGSCVEQTG
jgi:hypothetical protein